ncbi:DUF1488 domain-containing protein [Vibrio mexicanus]|uniref:DUF1488 domain-containing protein n=1 Tax=Vibrio mexicanus TaxID=1004326 RepID=UPI00063C9877|nr:DUF1488 domain-containing protein [Vibrio mexicanus]
MNQSILFPDMQSWDEGKQAVMFPAQQSGALIECVVGVDKLAELVGHSVEGKEAALNAFEQCRFDLEELAEELIEDEMFNSNGR